MRCAFCSIATYRWVEIHYTSDVDLTTRRIDANLKSIWFARSVELVVPAVKRSHTDFSYFEDSIKSMYFSCAYETAWQTNLRPPFCAAFTKAQLKVRLTIIPINNFILLSDFSTVGHIMISAAGIHLFRFNLLLYSRIWHSVQSQSVQSNIKWFTAENEVSKF